MAKSVSFNGQTAVGTGTIVRVNVLNQDQLPSQGRVIGLIGEAEGGEPGSSAGLVSLRDAMDAQLLYRSGPLVDAIRLAFDSSSDPFIPGGPAEVVVYKTNASTQSEVDVFSYNTAAGGIISANTVGASPAPTTTSVRLGTGLGLTTAEAAALVGHWVRIEVSSLTQVFTRKVLTVTSGANTDITFSPALPAVPTAADDVFVYGSAIKLTSRDYGSAVNQVSVDVQPTGTGKYEVTSYFNGNTQVSPALGGRDRFKIQYIGGAVSTTKAADVGATTTTIPVTVVYSGANSEQNKTASVVIGGVTYFTKVVSNTTTVLTVSPALPSAPAAAAVVKTYTVTDAIAQFQNSVVTSGGQPDTFVTTITGVTGDNLSITLDEGMTLRELIAKILVNTNYIASVPNSVNQDTTLARDFDFSNVTAEAYNIQASMSLQASGFRQDVMDVVNWINNNAAYLTAARSEDFRVDGGQLNIVSPVTDDFEGLQLSGAVRGTSADSDFQAGFDAMLTRPIDDVIPLIDEDLDEEGFGSTATWDSVSQQLVDHVDIARGALGLERGGFIGFVGTKTELIAAANSLNDTDIAIVSQNPQVLNATGSVVTASPRQFAVMAASMRVGAGEIGEALTHKFIKTSGVTQDTSWDPGDATDIADLVTAGVLFAQNIPGRGTRWYRDLTTWVKDENLCYTDGNVRDIVRFVVYNLRTMLGDRFIGRKATPATIASVKEAVASLLEAYRTDNIIVDSTDPLTGKTVKAYHNLKVFSVGDVLKINVGIFPAPSVNFILLDVSVDLASQLAA